MATVTKDFRIKSGLVVEGANATVDGSDIITEDAITGGTQTNISVTYDAQTKTVSFVAENGVGDSTTDDLDEGSGNLYFTDQRALDAVAANLGTGIVYSAENAGNVFHIDETYLAAEITDGARSAVGVAVGGTPLTYDSQTGVFGIDIAASGGINLDNNNDLQVDRQVVDTWYDPAGAADAAEQNANDYTDSAIAGISTVLDVAGDTSSDSITIGADVLTIQGGEGVDVEVVNNTFTVSAEDATEFNKGIASFDGDHFTVTNGAVSANSATLGSSTITLGSTTPSLAGLESLAVDNISIDGNTISSTDSNGDIHLNPNGTGAVSVNSSRIIDVATPQASTDAATKAYVDSVAEGLHVHASAVAATTGNVDISTDLQPGDYVDDVLLAQGNRVLVKSQTNAAQNGIYVVQASGAALRAEDFDSPAEVDGGDFIFVTGGDTYADTGWVQTAEGVVTIGVDPIIFTQFSGAGTYLAGTNLELDGNTFSLADNITLSTVTADLTGNVTGDVDGNLTGNVTGQVSDISNHDTGDLAEGSNLYFTDQRAYDAVDGSSTINFVEVELNSIAKQVAVEGESISNAGVTLYQYSPVAYRSAKFLVKLASGTHTQVSEVLLTLDTSNNIAITEYAIVGTNGNLGNIVAQYVPPFGPSNAIVRLEAEDLVGTTTFTVVGTLLA